MNVIARAKISLGQRPSFESIYQDAVNIDGLCMQYFERWLDRDQPGWKESFDESELARQDKTIAEQAKKTGRSLKAIAMLAYIRENDLHDAVGDALISIMSNDRTYFEKLVSSLYPLLEKLTTGKMAELISPDYDNAADPRPVIDWMSVINQGGIVYVGLDSLTDFEVAGAVGNAMFADLTSIAGKLYKFGSGYGESAPGPRTQRISIHADEFNELIGDEFIPLLNKAGGAGYQVSVYTQTWSDVEARIGSRAKAQQIAGNLNTLIMLRVKNTDTAKILTDQLPEIDIITTTAASQASDSNNIMEFTDFTSRNEDRVSTRQAPMIAPSDLVQLPKGQAFALIEGGRLYKLRIPLPDASDDPHMPDNLEARGIALAAGTPAIGLTTLSVLAAPFFHADESKPLLAVIDARHSQVYMQLFGPGGRSLIAPRLATVRDAVRAAMASPTRIVGNAARLIEQAWPEHERRPALVNAVRAPDIGWVARLGAATGDTSVPLKPLYLREADAHPQEAGILPRR